MPEKYICSILLALIPVAVSALLFLILRKTPLKDCSKRKQQVIAGVVFGAVIILEIIISYPVYGGADGESLINCTDVIPMCAGFIFGGLAGIISAIIGVIFRGLSIFMGVSAVSVFPECFLILFSGLFAAFLSRFLFDRKRPAIFFGLVISCFMSQLHLVCLAFSLIGTVITVSVFISNVQNGVVICDIIALTGSLIVIRLIRHKSLIIKNHLSNLEKRFKAVSISCFCVVFVLVTITSFLIFTRINYVIAQDFLESKINSIEKVINNVDIEGVTDNFILNDNGFTVIADENGNVIIPKNEDYPDLESFGIKVSKDMSDVGNCTYGGMSYYCMCRRCDSYIVVASISTEMVYYYRRSELALTISLEIIIMALMFMLVLFLFKRFVIDNVKESNEELRQLIGYSDGTKSDSAANEEAILIDSSLSKYTQKVVNLISGEIKLAGDVQMHSLPLPKAILPGVSVNAFIVPARQVGGDFYDYFALDRSRNVVLIADVSGKGVSAAMFMMRAKAAVRAVSAEESDVEKIFNKVNQIMCEGNPEGLFVTMWMGIIDINTGHVSYVNAAQGDIIVRHPEGSFEFLEGDPELPLGVFETKNYTAREFDMAPGSRLFLYTDGVTDANNLKDEMFEVNRLTETLNSDCKIIKGDELIETVYQRINDFAMGAEQFDDITMLVADYFGKMDDLEIVSKSFTAADENLDEVTDFINGVINENGELDDGQMMVIDVCFEELFVNISHYGFGGQPGQVLVEVSRTGGVAAIRLTDAGIPFNPLTCKSPDPSIPLKERKEGGLGITMVRECMDYVDYSYDNGKNIFTMMKIVK